MKDWEIKAVNDLKKILNTLSVDAGDSQRIELLKHNITLIESKGR